MNYELGFIGAGKMGGAILSAIIGAGTSPASALVCDASPQARERLAALGAAVCEDPAKVARECRTVFVAVKPQDFDALLASLAGILKKSQLVVSIAAGKTLSTMRALLGPKPRLVRVMPNLAALVGEGMMVYAPDASASAADVRCVEALLATCGRVLRLDESLFDAVTALSGSGPAFYAFAMKAMADGGAALGLPPDAALALALQTMLGTSKYLAQTGQDADSFIKAVCSPKGTTEAGMKVLSRSSVASAFAKTLAAAARRSAELRTT